MSYLVHLWREPVPASLTQAQAVLRDLRQQLCLTPDPQVRHLIEAITARLPPGHEPDDFWTELPDAEPSSPLLMLSPKTEELGTVLPAVMAAAREQGWVVHDGQSGEVWLPDGRVLQRAQTVFVPEAPPGNAADSPAVRLAWLRERLAPVFERHGFRRRTGELWFSKALAFGEARLIGRTVMAGLNHALWIHLNYPPELQGALDADGGPQLSVSLHRLAARAGLPFSFNEPPALFQQEPGGVVYELPCNQAEALERCGDALTQLYAEQVLPWLDSLQTWADLDRCANRVPDADCPFNGLRRRSDYRLLNRHPDLLIARVVGAADFEAMARHRLALYEADAFGRGLVSTLRSLLQVCGLALESPEGPKA